MHCTTTAVAAAFGLFASAHADIPVNGLGGLDGIGSISLGSGSGDSMSNKNPTYYTDAGRHPNATHEIQFTRPGVEGEWTWRVNVTDLPAEDNQTEPLVNMQWDLQWPGGGSLQEFLGREQNETQEDCPECQTCVTAMMALLPHNITSKWQDDGSGDCTQVLGAQCYQKPAGELFADPER